ncbi:aminotransferase class V-fold PLP-dependent enzyme, partial [Fulvivirgaceae bacterium PWU5]
VQHVITSPVEHHAVSHTLEVLARQGWFKLHHVTLDEKGHINLDDLETLLKENPHAVVSLMHANNEIGNLLDIERVG